MNHVEHDISELPGGTKRRMVWQAWLLLLAGLIVTALAASYTKSQEDAAAAREFDLVCNEIEGKILDRLNAHEQILRSGAAFYEHAVYVTRQQWHDFTERQKIVLQLPGIQGIGFARLIPRQKLAQHIQQVRDEGFPAYQVRPEGEREIYSSIIYLEPFTDRNLRAFGYDMLTEPVRRAAMERARDTDSATLSGKVILKQETDQDIQAGTLMYVPVYRKGMPRETIEQRRAALLGWVYSTYRMNDLMRGILGRWDLANNRRIGLEIFDGRQATPDTLLYDSCHADSRRAATASQMTLQRPIISAGHQWTLNFTRAATSIAEYAKVWLVLFGGTITSLLLAQLFFNLYNTRFNAQQLAGRLTADLQNSTARLALATDAGGVGIWDYDVIHNKLIWDDQMFRLYGIKREQFIGAYEAWTAEVHPEDRERCDKEMKMALRGEKEFDTEFRVLWPDGSTHCIRALARVQRNAAGQAVSMVGTNWDITKSKQTEEELRLNREKFELAVRGSQDGIWDWNLRDNSLYISPRWKQQLGYQDDELANEFKSFEQLLHPDHKPDVMNYIDSYLKSDEHNYSIELRMRHKTGAWRWILARGAAILNEQGVPVRMAGSHTDITERKQVEHYRILSGEVLSILNESTDFKDSIQRILAAIKLATGCAAVAVRLQDGDDFPYLGQQGFPEDFMLKENSLIAGDADGGICMGPDGSVCLESTCDLVLSGKTDSSNALFTRGGSFWTNSSGPILNLPAAEDPRLNQRNQCFKSGYNSVALIPIREKQRIVGLLQLYDHRAGQFSLDAINALEEMACHIGEALLRKKTEAALKESETSLREMNSTKDKFFSIIAHDLRAPLSSFAGMTEIMAEESSNLKKAEIQEFAVCMRDSASNTYRLLENLLNWATSQRGLIPFKPEIVPLLPVVKECIGLMLESAKNKDIEIMCGAPDNIAVFADRNMLQTVIRNLISNAVKFTHKGGKISVSAKITDNGDVEVAIIDSGIGMDSATIEELFRIDVRSSRPGTSGEHGTGIGLPLSKEFVGKMGGRIWVESEENKGSVFYFTIPCKSEHGSKSIAEIAPAIKENNQFKDMKILIVEDDQKSEILIKIVVRRFAREILIARTGVEALEVCRKTPDIDLILMDIAMPEMDGYEATSKIRQFNKDVIIIAQTAYAFAGEREKSIAAGCNDYITKPFNKTSLTGLLEKYF